MSSLGTTRSFAPKPGTSNRRTTVEVEIEIAPADLCWIDGFITAVAIGPEKIPQHEWLANIGLVDERVDDLPIAANSTGMLVKLHDKVLQDLRRSPERYAPMLGASLAGPRLGLAVPIRAPVSSTSSRRGG